MTAMTDRLQEKRRLWYRGDFPMASNNSLGRLFHWTTLSLAIACGEGEN